MMIGGVVFLWFSDISDDQLTLVKHQRQVGFMLMFIPVSGLNQIIHSL